MQKRRADGGCDLVVLAWARAMLRAQAETLLNRTGVQQSRTARRGQKEPRHRAVAMQKRRADGGCDLVVLAWTRAMLRAQAETLLNRTGVQQSRTARRGQKKPGHTAVAMQKRRADGGCDLIVLAWTRAMLGAPAETLLNRTGVQQSRTARRGQKKPGHTAVAMQKRRADGGCDLVVLAWARAMLRAQAETLLNRTGAQQSRAARRGQKKPGHTAVAMQKRRADGGCDLVVLAWTRAMLGAQAETLLNRTGFQQSRTA